MAATTTYIKYGGFETTSSIICDAVRIIKKFDSFNINGDLLVIKDSTANLKTALDNISSEFRKINQHTKITINGQDFIDLDPASNESMVIRGETNTPEFIGAVSAKVSFSLEGRIPPQDQLSAGYYPFEMNFDVSQSERVTATFTGVYTATGVNSASVNYADATTGAEARCASLLATFFAGRSFDLVQIKHSRPEEADSWLRFTLIYIEQVMPNAKTAYDFSQIIFTRHQTSFGQKAYNNAAGEIYGKSLAGGLAQPSNPIQRWSISGFIPVKSQTKNYDDLMNEWEADIKPALYDFIKTYFMAKAAIPSSYGRCFIESESTPFNVTENGITPNIQIVVPADGGILEFSETLISIYNPQYITKYYVNGEDNFHAWIGKLPDSYIVQQHARVTKIDTVDTLPPPPLPEGMEDVVWIQEGEANIRRISNRYRITDSANRNISLVTIDYSATWKLVKIVIPT